MILKDVKTTVPDMYDFKLLFYQSNFQIMDYVR